MTAHLHPYTSYKPSSVPWLGDVPEHWEVVRLSTVSRPKSVVNQQHRQLLSVYLNLGVIRFSDVNEKRTNPTSQDLSQYQAVDPGDVVLNNQQAWRGSVGVSNLEGIVSPAYLVLTLSSRLDPNFADLLFRDKSMVEQYVICSKGVGTIQRNLYWPHLKRIATLLPPLPEQRAIVRYLDHVDRRIRRYVSAKRKLIALLEEEKQAVVNRAVTRGLDPNVRLKPSGVEWLGDVPEHWDILRVGHFSKVGNGSTPSRGNAAYWTDGVHPWLNSSSVNQGTITRADQFVTDLALRECHLPCLRPGSVLVGITGQGKTRGMSAVLTIDATINQHMAFITPKKKLVSSHYLQMCLTAAYRELRAISSDSGSTKAALTCEDIKCFMVVLPPRDEQETLLSQVRRELASVDDAIARSQRQIELLQEYRTRLIADVVTGKLDVREAASLLPDETDDQDPIEEGDPLAHDVEDESLTDMDRTAGLVMEEERL